MPINARANFNDVKDLKVLKDLKILNTTTTDSFELQESNSSSSINLTRAREEIDTLASDSVESDLPKNGETVPEMSADQRQALAMFAKVFKWPHYIGDHPRADILKYTYQQLLEMAIRHAGLITNTTFPLDEYLLGFNHKFTDFIQPAAYKLLYFIGVTDPKLKNLTSSSHCSPRYVLSQMAKSLALGDKNPKLLIHRIQNCDQPPELNEGTGHIATCRCDECQRYAYRSCPYCSKYPCTCGRYTTSCVPVEIDD
jgi:hypothetical protein